MNKIFTDNAPKAIGPYSQAMVVDGYLFTSGQIPINPVTSEIDGEDIIAQTERVCSNLEAVLEEAGASFNDVIKTTCFLSDMDNFAAFNEVYIFIGCKLLPQALEPALHHCRRSRNSCQQESVKDDAADDHAGSSSPFLRNRGLWEGCSGHPGILTLRRKTVYRRNRRPHILAVSSLGRPVDRSPVCHPGRDCGRLFSFRCRILRRHLLLILRRNRSLLFFRCGKL